MNPSVSHVLFPVSSLHFQKSSHAAGKKDIKELETVNYVGLNGISI